MAHFYEAQLIHYGLQCTKDKNVAKLRLINAITAKALAVPGHIPEMEADMRKEYARKVRASARAAPIGSKSASAGKRRQTNDSGNGSATTISVQVGDTTLEINQHDPRAAPTTKKKVGPVHTPKKVTSKKPVITHTVSKYTHSGFSPKHAGIKISQQVRTTTGTASSPNQPVAASKTKAPRGKHTAKHSQPVPGGSAAPQAVNNETPAFIYETDSNVDMEDAPPAYDSLDFNHYSDNYPSSNATSSTPQITGSYGLFAPLVGTGELAVHIDKAAGSLWGKFKIDSKNGILFMNSTAGIAEQAAVSFGWRAEDEETGDMRFGRGCNGSIQFNGRGNVRGRFFGLSSGQDVEFEGDLQNENVPNVVELNRQWDRFPQIAYGRR